MRFDVCGPLPTGVTVLEASAGTGKTYAIAALAARYIADGTPLDELLLVTFTRMATGELRERVRQRLVETERGLRTGEGDEVVQLLADGPPEVVAQRRAQPRPRARRLRRRDDRHHARLLPGGARRPRRGRRRRARQPVRRGRHRPRRGGRRRPLRAPLPQRGAARRSTATRPAAIARIAIENPVAPIEPSGAAEDSVPAMRARLAEAVRRELRRRKERAGAHDLRRPAHAARRHAARAGRRGRRAAAARALPRRAGRRVPGHRPGPVEHPAPRLRRRRQHARAHRRPEAGDLRLPRRRRLRLPRRRQDGGRAGDARTSTGAATKG